VAAAQSTIDNLWSTGMAVFTPGEHVTETQEPETPSEHPKGKLRRFEDAVHDHLLAAEVAAEEAAGYGSLTAAREAAETAVNPAHELGSDDDPTPSAAAAEPPAE
jgi:hypothetical protein